MFALLFFLILPSLVHSHCPPVEGIKNFEYDTADYRLKCVPELKSDNSASPSTVCVVTCKRNNLRFKHRCNRNGKWDMDPDLTK